MVFAIGLSCSIILLLAVDFVGVRNQL